MDNLIINNAMTEIGQNITFTRQEWLSLVASVNSQMYYAMLYGIIIGALVGVAGLYLGMWYRGRKG